MVEAATPEFYSTCIQVLLVAWLVLGVETQMLRSRYKRRSWITWPVMIWFYAGSSMAAIVLQFGLLMNRNT